jgi:hypothetical protein
LQPNHPFNADAPQAARGWRLFVGKNRSNLSLNGNSSTERS